MAKKPNILFIFTDQHRLSAVGAYGATPCMTPNLDALAQEGTLFTNAYTTYPVCSPARGSIITGLFPHAHGITGNLHDQHCAVHEIEDRPELLSRRLQAAGYALGYNGKWHLGTEETTAFHGSNRPTLPRDVGFDGHNFPGHGNGGHGFPEYKEYLQKNGLVHKTKPWSEKTARLWFMDQVEGPAESTPPYFLAESSIAMMQQFAAGDKPFFLWHNFWGPHAPFYVPSSYVDRYRDIDIPPWPNYDWPSRTIPGSHHVVIHPDHEKLTWDDWAMAVRYYYAFTTLIDEQIGRMVDYLKDSGQLDNTIIIFSSDHGQTLGSHGGLTDKGWHHFDEIQRIPMIVRMPGGRGRKVDDLVSLADIYPTILDFAGGSWNPDDVHGESLVPHLRGEGISARDMVVTEFDALNNIATTLRTVRWENMKYGFNPAVQDELYDLERDPHETLNLINHPGYRDAAEEGRQRLITWMKQTDDRMSWWFRRMYGYLS